MSDQQVQPSTISLDDQARVRAWAQERAAEAPPMDMTTAVLIVRMFRRHMPEDGGQD